MGTVHEFPLWRAQRSPPPCTLEAEIVVFPGVRIERDGADREPAGSAELHGAGPDTRNSGNS